MSSVMFCLVPWRVLGLPTSYSLPLQTLSEMISLWYTLPFMQHRKEKEKKNGNWIGFLFIWMIIDHSSAHLIIGCCKICIWLLVKGDLKALFSIATTPRCRREGATPFPGRGCPCGVMVKAMDCGIVVREFVLQSRHYVHFRANTLWKGMNPLILPAMG